MKNQSSKLSSILRPLSMCFLAQKQNTQNQTGFMHTLLLEEQAPFLQVNLKSTC